MRGVISFLCFIAISYSATDWRQFRGPNGSGVSDAAGLPLDFSLEKNLLWKTPLPKGHSSPVFASDRIFLTGHEDEKLYVFGLERKTGKILWRKQVPRLDPSPVPRR